MPVTTFININYTSVLIAGFFYFLFGLIWYSPSKYFYVWEKFNLIKPGELSDQYMTILVSFLSTISSSMMIAFFITLVDCRTVLSGLWISIISILVILPLSIAVSYLFEDRKIKFYFIDAGYHLIGFMIMGTVLSTWR